MGTAAAFMVEDQNIQQVLEKTSTLNVTIAIGLSALSISFGDHSNKRIVLNEILLLLMISLITFFVSVINVPDLILSRINIHRIYFCLSSIYVAYLVFLVGDNLLKTLDEKEEASPK